MNPRTGMKSFVVALPLTCLTACGLFSGGQDNSLAQVDDLVGWVERVHVNAELAREKAHAALDTLQAIADSNFGGDPVEAYSGLLSVIQDSERQAQVLRNGADSMRQTAMPLFDRWSNDLMQFTSTRMRLRSQNRLLQTRERYDAVVTALEPAQKTYDELNKSLRDHALFLGHDMNEAAVAELAQDVRELTKLAGTLDSKLDACLEAARAYVEASALPVTASPKSTPPAPGGAAPRRRSDPVRERMRENERDLDQDSSKR